MRNAGNIRLTLPPQERGRLVRAKPCPELAGGPPALRSLPIPVQWHDRAWRPRLVVRLGERQAHDWRVERLGLRRQSRRLSGDAAFGKVVGFSNDAQRFHAVCGNKGGVAATALTGGKRIPRQPPARRLFAQAQSAKDFQNHFLTYENHYYEM
jgi:5-methylcytosine-specific restriction endonuclease McrA